MVTVFEALVLGVLQGVTEWLPVSSSGHLALMQNFMRVEVPVFFDVVLHLGTLLAVCAVYRQDLQEMIKSVLHLDFASEHGRLALLIVLASIPTAVIGFTFHDYFASLFTNIKAVGLALIFTGAVLYSTRNASGKKKIGGKHALAVGATQGVSIIPGVSRSGLTISAGLLLGLDREKVARFSLLLSIPAIIGAGIFEPILYGFGGVPAAPMAAGFAASLLVGYASIRLLLKLLSQGSFYKFAYYCWIVGAVALLI